MFTNFLIEIKITDAQESKGAQYPHHMLVKQVPLLASLCSFWQFKTFGYWWLNLCRWERGEWKCEWFSDLVFPVGPFCNLFLPTHSPKGHQDHAEKQEEKATTKPFTLYQRSNTKKTKPLGWFLLGRSLVSEGDWSTNLHYNKAEMDDGTSWNDDATMGYRSTQSSGKYVERVCKGFPKKLARELGLEA